MATSINSLESLEDKLEEIFVDKAPFQLPKGAKEAIVKYGPWITLVILIISLPGILFAFGLGAMIAPFAVLGGYRGQNLLPAILGLVALVLEGVAIPGLLARKKSGWNMLFYASLVMAVADLISFDIAGLVISLLIGWYFLFQIRSYYK